MGVGTVLGTGGLQGAATVEALPLNTCWAGGEDAAAALQHNNTFKQDIV
jgi:hypothetical protein